MHQNHFFRLETFHDWGFRGLYAGETLEAVMRRKGVIRWQEIFAWMNHAELAANMARVLMIQKLLREEAPQDITAACQLHYEVGRAIRQAIIAVGDEPPECHPTPLFRHIEIDVLYPEQTWLLNN